MIHNFESGNPDGNQNLHQANEKNEAISLLLAHDLTLLDDAVIVRMFSCFLPDGMNWNTNEWNTFYADYSKAFIEGDWSGEVYDVARDSWMHWYFIVYNGSNDEISLNTPIEIARGALIARAFGYN